MKRIPLLLFFTSFYNNRPIEISLKIDLELMLKKELGAKER